MRRANFRDFSCELFFLPDFLIPQLSQSSKQRLYCLISVEFSTSVWKCLTSMKANSSLPKTLLSSPPLAPPWGSSRGQHGFPRRLSCRRTYTAQTWGFWNFTNIYQKDLQMLGFYNCLLIRLPHQLPEKDKGLLIRQKHKWWNTKDSLVIMESPVGHETMKVRVQGKVSGVVGSSQVGWVMLSGSGNEI